MRRFRGNRLAIVTVAALSAAVLGGWLIAGAEAEQPGDEVKIASLVRELDGVSQEALATWEAVPVRPFEVPQDSVDVMRARLTETYSIDGVGEDTVELSGWIAVKHFNARPVEGETHLTWETAVVDTQFVGLKLEGRSEVFGRVQVLLDADRPAFGKVGEIEIPEAAKIQLAATAEAEGDTESAPAVEESSATEIQACEAQVNVAVVMPDLDLEMVTEHPVSWYSHVTTIPPVGHVASIAIEPVRLVSEGREVGTLESGKVNFREVVRQVTLQDTREWIVADAR